MKKRTIAIALAALLMTACTACGKEEMPSETTMLNGEIAADGGFADAKKTAGAPIADAPEAAAEYDGGEAVYAPAADEAYAADADYEAVPGDMPVRDAAAADAACEEIAPVIDEIPGDVINTPQAGLLTAGRWRDHDNWGFFSNLVNNDAISFPSFGLDPTQRISVTVRNAAGEALPNAHVTLTDADGTAVWNAVSDQNGIAYVFDANGTGASVTVTPVDGTEQSAEVPSAVTDDQGGIKKVSDRIVEVTIDTAPVLFEDMQVMFIVDTTGSMGDEMLYLQSDFGTIAEDSGDDHTSWSVAFYKDAGDEYVTRGDHQFTGDAQAIKNQLNAECAGGGGDEPEAVAEALNDVFSADTWASDSVKVAFLIYDAPPHAEKSAEIVQAIETAADKGIHLVPVVSSNGSRETELFGRAAAICTNGDYVFLTDDSGIGGSHLEPIIGDYEVQPLHDVIVQIVNDYRQK